MRWRRKDREPGRGHDREQDLERELRSDLELEAAEQRNHGLSPQEARDAARRAFGNPTLIKEEVRALRTSIFFDRLIQDLRYALRGMRKSPGFTLTAALSLALGIGANTAIFSLIDTVLLRSLPVRDPQELVQLVMRRNAGPPGESFTYPLVQALAEHNEIFAHLCGFSDAMRLAVGSGDSLESTPGVWVTGSYYATLGLQPEAGRLLTRDDDWPGAGPVAVISDGYWQRKFGRDPRAIGQSIVVEGKPVTIAGVSPPGFTGVNVGETADLTLPLGTLPQFPLDRNYSIENDAWWLRILARPRPGVSRAQATARLDVIWHPLAASVISANMPPAVRRRVEQSTLDPIPGGTGWTDLRRQFRQPLLALMAVTGLLLLIACANVANLLLARASARQREIAVRMAIGAGRARIVRQLLTESLLLSLLGAALGVALAGAASRALVDLLSAGRLHALVLDVAPDWRVLAFTGAAALLTAMLFGIAPAFQGTAFRPGSIPGAALRERVSISRSRLGAALVAAQVSVALLLLIAAGLFVRTLQNLHRVDPGFRENGVLVVNADATRAGYRGPRAAAFYAELQRQIEGLPGVASASFSLTTPLKGGGISQYVGIEGRLVSRDEIYFNSVSRRFFETMGTPVIAGREFTPRDDAASPKVAVVNRAFAERYLPDRSPLGVHLTVGSLKEAGTSEQEFEVVGVVGNSIYESLWQAAPPTVYVPLVQRPGTGSFGVVFEARAAGSLLQVSAALRSRLQPMLPAASVEVHTLTEQMERALVRERMMATLAAAFGILGLVLAVVGIYGLLAFTVARRTSEIGIRLALGAMRREVLWMVLQRVLALLGIGIAVGIPVAWAVSRFVSSMLFGLTPMDPLTIVAATAALATAGVLAALLPAWRASQVDPMVALRYE